MNRCNGEQFAARIAGRAEDVAFVVGEQFHLRQPVLKDVPGARDHRLVGATHRRIGRRTMRDGQIGQADAGAGEKIGDRSDGRLVVVDPRHQHGLAGQGAAIDAGKGADARQDRVQSQVRMRLVQCAPGDGIDAVDLEADPVGLGQIGAHVLAPDQRGIGNHGDRQAERAQHIDRVTEMNIQCGLAVRNEGQKIHRLALFAQRLDAQRHVAENFLRRIEGAPFDFLMLGGTDLAVAAGIGTVLGRDMVDAEAAAEPARGNGAECDVHRVRCPVRKTPIVTMPA
jgi:hypothetical protein